MPWLARLRRAEKKTAESTPDPASRLAVLAEQQVEVAKQLRDIVELLRSERTPSNV